MYMSYIKLSGKNGKGKRTLVDENTYNLYGHLTWYMTDTGYAVRRPTMDDGKKVTIRLHRLVTKAPEGLVVDHLNGDTLDNRLSNLRVCTGAVNAKNRHNTKGYAWDNNRGKYIVRYKRQFYGRYDTEAEAKRVYRLACSGVPYMKRERRKMYHLPKGVFKNKGNKGYQAKVNINGERTYLGTFATIEEAEKAYLDRKRG